MPTEQMKKQSGWIVGIALLGVLIYLVSTAKGTGIGGDATIYLTSARHLVEGKGLGLIGPQGEFRLLPYFPPFFPLVISLFIAFGVDGVMAAHLLNGICFGLTIWLAGWVTLRASRSLWLAALAALLAALSPVLIPVYSWAMSEPLAILLGFGALSVLLDYFEEPAKKSNLVISALLAGLSLLTRYSSAAFVGAWAVLVLFCAPCRARARFESALVYGLVGSLPILGWIFYDLSQTASVASRSVEQGAGLAQRLADFGANLREVLLFWFVPDSWIASPPYPAVFNTAIIAAALLGMAALVVLGLRKMNSSECSMLRRLVLGLLVFCGLYSALILLVSLTTYPPITIGSRMFSPVHLAFVWLVVLLVGALSVLNTSQSVLKTAGLAVLCLLAGWYGLRSLRIVQQNFSEGLGYQSLAWTNSETMRAVKDLPAGQLIVTNEETAILFLSGRASYPLQEIFANSPDVSPARYGDGNLEEDAAEKLFRDGKALLVVFDSLPQQVAGLYGDQAESWAAALTEGLEVVYQAEDGAIYRYR
ncbi:MAG: hypothetical protein GYA48_05790 [Chloroflexi bacterium]|nr:hypothetical protein [Chloroflexota bacterium]